MKETEFYYRVGTRRVSVVYYQCPKGHLWQNPDLAEKCCQAIQKSAKENHLTISSEKSKKENHLTINTGHKIVRLGDV